MSAVRRAARGNRPLLHAAQRLHPLTQSLPSLELLRDGELEIIGRLNDASNATFVCRLGGGPLCVYKPTRGEAPLSDFPPHTLARREVAAYLLSVASGWNIVPPTVLRDGPFGQGMAQAWIEVDEQVDLVELVLGADPRLRTMCLFDVLANNADRKGSHVLPLESGALMGVDHGICFAREPKLRTVLWAWRGELIADDELAVIKKVLLRLEGDLGVALAELLSEDEVGSTVERARALVEAGRFPEPGPARSAVPWPPF